MSQDVHVEMTIGSVSRATGIPSNTIRTWERRYGFPRPERTDGGHRLYPSSVVPHLKLVARALELGHRPRQILALPLEQLRELVYPAAPMARPPADPQAADLDIDGWLDAARRLDGDALDRGLRAAYGRFGGLLLAESRVAPFLDRLGAAWESGELDVYQEHFASERVRGFVMEAWRSLSAAARGPTVVCATLPGEQHALGLHLAALVLAVSGFRVTWVGSDLPIADIAACAKRAGAVAVAISVSAFFDPAGVRPTIETLRAALPDRVQLLLGGKGAPADIAGTVVPGSLRALADWRPV